MAQAAQMNDTGVQLIEEQVETGLKDLLASYEPTYIPGGAVSDIFDDQFVLNPSKKLPEFSHPFAEAFEAKDNLNSSRKLYAMVCDPDIPNRAQALSDASGFKDAHLTLPVAHGAMRCSHVGEARYVMFFEMPHGAPLSKLIADETRMHESKVISFILAPACAGLIALRDHKIAHGNIRPENFFLDTTPMFGEMFSAPAGTLSHFIYHSTERMIADPMGYGEADEKSDVYALAVMAFEAMYGLSALKSLPREEFIRRVLTKGVHQVFSNGRDFPPAIQDFFRGVLTDNIAERWDLNQLQAFVDGKRFNMAAPTPPKDAARPFTFADEMVFSRRYLAHVLHKNWKLAVKDIRSLNIERWCETSLNRPEVAEQVERAMRIGADKASSERQINDMMTRIFMALDPVGPLRAKTLSVRPDGIPLMLSSLADTREPELYQLINMIESEISAIWSENSPSNKSADLSQVNWRLQRVRPYLKMNALGFGLERVLYELNPSLPCQSPMLKPFHVTTAIDALQTLDVMSKTKTGDHTVVDRHLAAFLAAKIDLRKQVRLSELTSIDALIHNNELAMLRILSIAQQKSGSPKLVGLCAWAGMHVEKMTNEIHNRVVRRQQKLKLKRRAAGGMLVDVLSAVLNRDIGDNDYDGFIHAMALHEINYKRIQLLKNPKVVEFKAKRAGGQMAVIISYTAMTIMLFHVLGTLFGV